MTFAGTMRQVSRNETLVPTKRKNTDKNRNTKECREVGENELLRRMENEAIADWNRRTE